MNLLVKTSLDSLRVYNLYLNSPYYWEKDFNQTMPDIGLVAIYHDIATWFED